MDLPSLPPEGGNLTSEAETLSPSVDWYKHTTLDSSIDCIRLIYLSRKRVNGDISCSLKHVPFADRPKYEALSYSWGDLFVKYSILVDGKRFQVGTNLFLALSHFVDGKRDRILWIDAICIDQNSVEEKNWQLRLMPFIYRRAQKVLIWVDWPNPHINHYSLVSKVLCKSPYWKRLWIVQEIGQARELEVHYLEGSSSWVACVAMLKTADCNTELPLQLQREREDSYGSYTMLNLMRNHKDKLCKDRRDKIYALIGLARDIADSRYAVNYSTSLEQVYLDAIEYRNSDPSQSQHDIVEFSQLARQLLGVFLDDKPEIVAPVDTKIPAEKPNIHQLSDTVRVSAKLLGRVVCLGSTVEALLSSAKETETWNSLIMEECVKVNREVVSKENDFFLARLEDFFSNSQNVVETFEGWEPQRFDIPQDEIMTTVRPRPPSDIGVSTDVRLCLLYRFRDTEEASFLALVPPGTQPNSVICQISGIQRAIVLSLRSPMIRLIGSAAVAIPAGLIQAGKTRHRDFQDIFYVPKFPKLDRRDRVNLNLDLAFMHHLSRPLNMGSSTDVSQNLSS